MRDREMGFADKNFWGAYTVIEPEKPIENAIRKIQKNLKKLDR
jgi:predicted DNA-binding transcriptional regulator